MLKKEFHCPVIDIYCYRRYNDIRGDHMLANFEQRNDSELVWVGRYQNLHNISHWHLENEIIYIEKGNVLVSYNEQEYALETGDLFFINGGQVHYIHAQKSSIVQILMYDESFLPPTLNVYALKHANVANAYSFHTIFSQMLEEQKKKNPFYIEKIRILVQNLVVDIYRYEEIVKKSEIQKNEHLLDYKELLNEIQTQFATITFSIATEIMNLSPSYFSRYFHKLSGMTFSRYVNTIRIENAITLLKEHHVSITEISMRCGFDTIRHFNRTFKEITGIAPSHMPEDFILYHQTTKILHDCFNPTSEGSILL